MRLRWERLLLLFSLFLNVAFVAIAATHRRDAADSPDASALTETVEPAPAPPPPGGPVPPGPEARPGAPGPAPADQELGPPRFARERWQARRAARLRRALDLDRDQQRRLRERLRPLRPKLHEAHRNLVASRNAFRRALMEADRPGVLAARQRLSRAQAELDSLIAEAMWAECSGLEPAQRREYVRRVMMRHGRAPGPPRHRRMHGDAGGPH